MVKKNTSDKDFIPGYGNREEWPERSLDPDPLMKGVLKAGVNYWTSFREH